MRIGFPLTTNDYAEYCLACNFTLSKQLPQEASCPSCGKSTKRRLIIDPAIEWWTDDENTYWHSSVGIILVNKQGELLIIERKKFPPGFSIPAGHVNNGESPLEAVKRETLEEVGVEIRDPKSVLSTTIRGDSCRRGSDDHQWELFVSVCSADISLKADPDEIQALRWMSLEDFLASPMPFAMKFLFSRHRDEIVDEINSAPKNKLTSGY